MRNTEIEKNLDLSYNLDYLIIVPKKDIDIYDAFRYTFGNTVLIENTVDDVEFLTKFLRKNLIGTIVFVDYYAEYNEIINTLAEEHVIKFIFTGTLGELSDEEIWYDFKQICDKYDCKAINEIGILDNGLYKCIKMKRRNVKYVQLDVPANDKMSIKNNNSVGILSQDNSNYASYFNALSSFTFLPKYHAKVMNPSKTVLDFAKEYNINLKMTNEFGELISGNACNVDINFAGATITKFLKSMDLGIPCVVGNNSFSLADYRLLGEYLVMNSDDDVNEIADKVLRAIENRKALMEEYKAFRKEYSYKAKTLAEDFLGFDIHEKRRDKSEKLLSVIVPIYNTGQYLEKCLDSILDARIDDMEIILIDDGSTDDSEQIVKKYVKNNPELIRVIRQKNCGLGNVRNVGLMQARGKYLASVDSDDTIDNEFFKAALLYMQNDIDLIICDWMSVASEESFETAALDHVFSRRKELEGLLYTTIMPSTCNKIFKKSIFDDNNIAYLEQKYEDLSANPLVLLKARSIKYLKKPYYNYYLRNNSLMRSKVDPRQMVDVLGYLDEKLSIDSGNVNMEELKYYTYSWRIEEYIINPLFELSGVELKNAIEYIYKNGYKWMRDIFSNTYYVRMLEKLKSNELRSFIEKRNKVFLDGDLGQFIKETEKPEKLTAGIIYYGD